MGQLESSPGILQLGSDTRFPRSAVDRWVGLAAVGANGNAAPLQTFEELLNGTGSDESRAHNMTDACSIPQL
jgi:hypothetical protein